MKKINGQHLKFILYSAENISAMLFGLIGAAMVARVFGPENMGRLSVVQAVSTMLICLATFGLDHFVVRDFALNKNDGELKGSLILAQSVGWILYFVSLMLYFVVQGNLAQEVYLITSVAVSTYFLRVLFLKLYLQAINDAQSIAVAAVVSRIVALLFLVFGSINHFSYDMMVMYLPLQAGIQVLMMLKGYRQAQETPPDKVRVSYKRISSMLREAMPVMLATALYYAYSQADVIIVSHFVDVKEVGIYAAAMRLVPQAVFLGHVTVITFYGTLSHYYHTNQALFIQYTTKIARIQFAIGFLMAGIFSICSPLVIWALYGQKFSESALILSIGVWAWVFMLPACLLTRLLILAKLSKYELYKALITAPISIGLNVILIPHVGTIAAAFVFVFSFMLGDLVVYIMFKETRFLATIWLNAFTTLVRTPIVSFKETLELFHHKI